MTRLKKALIAAVLFVAVLACGGLASAGTGYMRISYMNNNVQIKTPEAAEWGPASINSPLTEGDEVWVPPGGVAELQLNTGTYIRLDVNTALQILSMDDDSSQFYLAQGRAYIFYKAERRGSVIQIDTPDASTRAFDRAAFGISLPDRYTEVAVYKGYVETENQAGETRVNAGQRLAIGRDTNGELSPLGPPDAWASWNHARDEQLLAAEREGERYLPPDLWAYSSDLDTYGNWVRVPEYGWCWTPRGVIDTWSPYREGRWIWRGDDYIWVAYEPWGWAPYHYGRWSFAPGIGWFWVPPARGSVYWGPGYVCWVRTPEYVGWAPLAPGEIYYGRGYFGRHSVNITQVNITQINITNVYKNVTINHGPVIVKRDEFYRGPQAIVHLDQTTIHNQIFTRHNFQPGGPLIKPTRESYFASERHIPDNEQPPQAIRQLQINQLKESRRLIREPDKSVLNPTAKPQTLPTVTVNTPRVPGRERPKFEQIRPSQPGVGGGQPRITQPQPPAPPGGRELRKERPELPQAQPPAFPGGREFSRPEIHPGQPAPPAAPPGKERRPEVQPQVIHIQPPSAPPPSGREFRPEPPTPSQPAPSPAPEQGWRTRERAPEVQPPPEVRPQVIHIQPPSAPSPSGREFRRERPELPPSQPPLPSPAPEEGWRTRERAPEFQPPPQVQPRVPEPQPAPPPIRQEFRREMPEMRPSQPAPPPPVPQNNWRNMERREDPAPQVQPQVVAPPQPAQPPAARELRRPEPPSSQPAPPPVPAGIRERQRNEPPAQQGQSSGPECGPGQRDAGNPQKCPQNFPAGGMPGRFGR